MGLVRIGGYPMDLAMSESHSFPGQVSEYPVEEGADISDHIRDMPPEITLECIVSDTPSGLVATDPTRTAIERETPLPSADALEKLRDMKALRKSVTVETSLGVFASMAFVDLDVPKDSKKSGGLFFTAKFKRVNTVTNKRTKVRVRTAMPGAGGPAKAKAVAGVPVDINRQIVWRHGEPPGTPWRFGNQIETVTATYTPTPGQTHDEIVEFRRTNAGSPAITYSDGIGRTITGETRAALVADLERNEAVVQAQENKEAAAKTDALADKLRSKGALPPKMSPQRFRF